MATENSEDFPELVRRLTKQDEKEKQREEARRVYKLEDMLDPDSVKTLVIPYEDGDIHLDYCPLRIDDRITLNKIKDSDPDVQTILRNKKTLEIILGRANPEYWTRKRIDSLPAHIVDMIIIAYDRQEVRGFLRQLLNSASTGSRLNPEYSA